MNKKTTGIIAYITWIGWIVAFCAGDKEGAKFHLNQALVILIGQIVAAVINYIPYVGGIVGTILSIFLFVCWIACKLWHNFPLHSLRSADCNHRYHRHRGNSLPQWSYIRLLHRQEIPDNQIQ